jgi:hypothetical protein
LSVGQIEINKPCKKCPSEEEMDAKKATIIRMRKYAKEIGETTEVTRAKIEAIRKHDMSLGKSVRCRTKKKIYVFSIRK